MYHTAPESVKRVKSSAQILGKMADGGWTPVNIDGVFWWPELPPSAFVALNLQKNDLSTVFVHYFLHVRSSVVSAWNTDKYFKYFFTYEVLPSPSLPFPYPRWYYLWTAPYNILDVHVETFYHFMEWFRLSELFHWSELWKYITWVPNWRESKKWG